MAMTTARVKKESNDHWIIELSCNTFFFCTKNQEPKKRNKTNQGFSQVSLTLFFLALQRASKRVKTPVLWSFPFSNFFFLFFFFDKMYRYVASMPALNSFR